VVTETNCDAEHNNELNLRLKQKNDQQKQTIENLQDELEHRNQDRIEISSGMYRET
jgi:hypothetical protein